MPQVHVELARNHMATTFRLVASCEDRRRRQAESVLTQAHGLIARLEDELSEFRPRSAVWELNHAPTGAAVRFGEDAFSLLTLALKIRDETDGAFDPFSKGDPCGKDDLLLDVPGRTALRLKPGVHLGFGAIGKGYALDRVRALLEREGFTDYLLGAGGSSSILSGYAAPGRPWEWAWSWKYGDDGSALGMPFSHFTGQPIALGVSGLHEKGRHIVDPRTREAAEGPSSALIGCQSAAWADAASTALFVGGLEAVSSVPRLAAAVAEHDDNVRWDDGFARLWGEPVRHGT